MSFWSTKSEGTSPGTVDSGDIIQDVTPDIVAEGSSSATVTANTAVPAVENLATPMVSEITPKEEPLPLARESFFPSLTPNEVYIRSIRLDIVCPNINQIRELNKHSF